MRLRTVKQQWCSWKRLLSGIMDLNPTIGRRLRELDKQHTLSDETKCVLFLEHSQEPIIDRNPILIAGIFRIEGNSDGSPICQ